MAFRTRSGKLYGTPDVALAKKCLGVSKAALTKSASKRLNLLGQQLPELEGHSLIDDNVLDEIFKLSPVSPVKRCKENIKPSVSNCRILLSPLRSLTLYSPRSKKVEAAQSAFVKNRLNLALSGSTIPTSGYCTQLQKSPTKLPLGDVSNTLNFSSPQKDNSSSPKKQVSPKRSLDASLKTASPSPTKKQKINKLKTLEVPSRKTDGSEKCSSPRKKEVSDSKQSTRKVLIETQHHNVPVKEIKVNVKSPIKHGHKDSSFSKIKHALHNAAPATLVGRGSEISEITNFISDHANNRTAGSLYISGAPGTGKSACMMNILSQTKVKAMVGQIINVNCMSIRSAASIYQCIASQLGALSRQSKTSRSALKYIENHLTSSGEMILLFLDEMDQLDSKHQEVLYTMFGWSSLKNSRMILIGIANSLDLTDRILPRLQARSDCKPNLMNFQPYTKDQLVKILQARVQQAKNKNNLSDPSLIDPMAIQFCARKVAAMTGDARKALDVCRRAVEVVETSRNKSTDTNSSVPQKVGLQQISNIMQGVYDSSNLCQQKTSCEQDNDDTFPLQQKLVVCTLFLLCKTSKCKEVPMGKLHESYTTICKKRQVPAVGQSEFVSLCELVESRGILSTRKAKQVRQSKVKLNMQEKDVEFALKGKALLSSILQLGL
uniref:Cell division control protein 6 homolog n=1 Tax=Phallusia mammillata TaxID=59560 RepID=A0A6F9D9E4_9ASCI|nr:cell division control protein 6 homolog [Phallusia mammillata]